MRRSVFLMFAVLLLLLFAGSTNGFAGFEVLAGRPHIDIDKDVAVDGERWVDADSAPGPVSLYVVKFRFVVMNNSSQTITNLDLTDTMFDLSGCPLPDELLPGDGFKCIIGPFECQPGQHMNIATITGEDESGNVVTASDPAHYFGDCDNGSPGTGTPGYWKNHPDAWPVTEITVGGLVYTREMAIAIMEHPVDGDKTFTMFPSLVAAMLNVMIGNDDSCIADVIMAADAWMADHPVGSMVEASSDAWDEGEPLHETLDLYNNGELCAPSRDDLENGNMFAIFSR